MRTGVSSRVASEELQLQEALKHIQELQDLLSEEEASQREWRTYAESKNVEALAAMEAMEALKREQVLMEDYISSLESDNATLKSCVDEVHQQYSGGGNGRAVAMSCPSSPTPGASPSRPPNTTAFQSPAATAGSLDWRRMVSPSSPAYIPAALYHGAVARLEQQVASLKEELAQSAENERFLKEKLQQQGGSLALATLNCGSAQLRERLLEMQAGIDGGRVVGVEGKKDAERRVDERWLRQELWQYAALLEEEKVVLAREMEEFQTSWLAAEERCAAVQQELEETRAALSDAATKEELLQAQYRRMERLASETHPSPPPSTPGAPPAGPSGHPLSPGSGSIRTSLSAQLEAAAASGTGPGSAREGHRRHRGGSLPAGGGRGGARGGGGTRTPPRESPPYPSYGGGSRRGSDAGGVDLETDCDAIAAAVLAPTPAAKGACGGVRRVPSTPDLLADSAVVS